MTMLGDRIIGVGGVRGSGIVGPPRGAAIMPSFAYTMQGSSSRTLSKLDPTGETVWFVGDLSSAARRVAVDPDGFIYALDAGDRAYKYTPDGVQVWMARPFSGSSDLGDSDIVVDGRGWAYIANDTGRMYALNADGVEQWEFAEQTFRGDIHHMAVDASDGCIYYAAGDVSLCLLMKVSPSGDEVWRMTDGDPGRAVVVGDGHVYFASDNNRLRKFTTDATLVWDISLPETITMGSMDYHPDGFLFIGFSDGSLRKVSAADGSTIWTNSGAGSNVHSAVCDPHGNVYVGSGSSGLKFRMIDPDGSTVWSNSEGVGTGYSIACDPGRYAAFPDHW